MDKAKERLKVICLTLAAVLLAIWILNQALDFGRGVDQVVRPTEVVPTATPISPPNPVLADEIQAPGEIMTLQPTVSQQASNASTSELDKVKESAKTETATVQPSPKPMAVAATATGYIDCVMETRTRGYTGFNGRIEVNGSDYSLEQFFPEGDWVLIIARESCANSRPAEPLSDRPNCIRQALNLIHRNYGLETGSSDESEFAGVLAIDLCSVNVKEG